VLSVSVPGQDRLYSHHPVLRTAAERFSWMGEVSAEGERRRSHMMNEQAIMRCCDTQARSRASYTKGSDMQPQRLVGLVVLVGGIVLLVMGIRETDSFSSQFSKFFTNSPTDRAVWLTIGGVAAIVVGGSCALRSCRSGCR
jgi:hypothetical protein